MDEQPTFTIKDETCDRPTPELIEALRAAAEEQDYPVVGRFERWPEP